MCSGFIEIHRAPIHTMNKLFDSVSLNYFCIYFFAAFFNFIMHWFDWNLFFVAAIKTHSPEKPVLVFVSSRRQTRLTALDLIAFLAAEDNPKQWLHMEEMEVSGVLRLINKPGQHSCYDMGQIAVDPYTYKCNKPG